MTDLCCGVNTYIGTYKKNTILWYCLDYGIFEFTKDGLHKLTVLKQTNKKFNYTFIQLQSLSIKYMYQTCIEI